MKSACVAAALLLGALSVGAAGKEPVSFSHNDWELACDNTRTCRAAGYQSDHTRPSEPVSMLLTRPAGPNTAIEVQLQVGGGSEVKGPLRFKVGKVTISGLEADTASFDAGQVRAILPELLKGDEATVTAPGGNQWTLSLAGLNAVLLKMDEAQGRIGTPGALVRKGSRPETSVLPPVPAPFVRTVTPVKARAGDDALAARIFPSLDLSEAAESCNNRDRLDAKAIAVSRLTNTKVLLSLGCGMGAYNYSSLLWIANDKPPYAPVALEANGEFGAGDGSVTSSMKGRGVGDCWSSEIWHFNGTGFVRTSASSDGMCRGFAGGAWNLPRYVSRPVDAAPSLTSSKP
ncbi:DUF1176 domain-containing protein [Acidovorax cavernicola]|uniref:DUF1176 domain-containing protein n=1 Tax=Acidovorax cavernicola TaxID=1675792 RepID=A0A9X8GT26_9BURK|nr:DUF1176 domain-containing protein [Acidovorax cavernicola]RIX74679.1 DUF1176 domain-containing protein [Acidovorax cavernicola]